MTHCVGPDWSCVSANDQVLSDLVTHEDTSPLQCQSENQEPIRLMHKTCMKTKMMDAQRDLVVSGDGLPTSCATNAKKRT